jgi:hypothetical protein
MDFDKHITRDVINVQPPEGLSSIRTNSCIDVVELFETYPRSKKC